MCTVTHRMTVAVTWGGVCGLEMHATNRIQLLDLYLIKNNDKYSVKVY